MLFHILAKERRIRELQLVAHLLDAQVGLTQIVTNVLEHMFPNPFRGCLVRVLLANCREILGRDAKFVGIRGYGAMLR